MKKAQVTMFVVVGLVVLIIGGIVLALIKDASEGTPPEFQMTHDFSTVIASYQSAAAKCLEDEGAIAFQEVFSDGGYIDPLNEGFVVLDDFPTRGNAIRFSPGDDAVVPFWFEELGGASCRDGCLSRLHIPPLEKTDDGLSIEERVEKIMLPRVINCLDGFTLTGDYHVDILSDSEVNVFIGKEVVNYELHRKVQITYDITGDTVEIHDFKGSSPAKARELYDIGKSLLSQMELMNSSPQFARAISTVINTFSGVENSPIPPMYGSIDLSGDRPRTWMLPEVKDSLSGLLADNIPQIQIRGTAGETLFLDPNHYSQVLYHTNGFKPELVLPHPEVLGDISIDFIYLPWWGLDLSINPSTGYLIVPDHESLSPIPFLRFGITDYTFTYNLVMPIIVVISDASSFEGKGLTLMFALETGLKDNKAFSEVRGDLGQISEVSASDLFSRKGNELWNSVTVKTINGVDNSSVADVIVGYSCGDSVHDLGVTELEDDGNATVTGSLPQCLGGILTASVDGYFAETVPLSIIGNESVEKTIKLWPLKDFKLKVRSKILAKDLNGGWSIGNDSIGYLDADDELVYVITRNTNAGEVENIQTGILNVSSESFPMNIELSVGSYDVQMYLIRYFGENRSRESFTIPGRTVDADGEDFDIPKIEFNSSMMIGGLELTKDYGIPFKVSVDDYSNSVVTFYYIEARTTDITTAEDLEPIGDVGKYSQLYNASLKPVFS